MPKKLSILMVAAEAQPLAKVGGLADVMGALPAALENLGHDVRIALPYYRGIRESGVAASPVKGLDVIDVPLGDSTLPAAVYSTRLPGSRVKVLLIANDHFFDREGIYTAADTGKPYEDNADRFIFFTRAVVRMLDLVDWKSDIIHCHDHQTGFIPAWIKMKPDAGRTMPSTVFTIHNLAYQGVFPKSVGYRAGFGEAMLKPAGAVEFHGNVNMMKAGISFADTVTAVSPTYAKEIQTAEFGYGLEGVLKDRSADLIGILNGADYSIWDPSRDDFIPAKYSPRKRQGKAVCRDHLIKRLGLKTEPDAPIVGIVSRLVAQKGFDILAEAFPQIMKHSFAFAILGLGDQKYHEQLKAYAQRYPGRVSVNLAFDEQLAHQIEAGCDMFLMPSKYEPCGLNQMYSMKYGTIPIVRRTGGLADTVADFDQAGEPTGFVFEDYTVQALLHGMERALQIFARKPDWEHLMEHAMRQDFSWQRAAEAYEAAYLATTRKRRVVTAG